MRTVTVDVKGCWNTRELKNRATRRRTTAALKNAIRHGALAVEIAVTSPSRDPVVATNCLAGNRRTIGIESKNIKAKAAKRDTIRQIIVHGRQSDLLITRVVVDGNDKSAVELSDIALAEVATKIAARIDGSQRRTGDR